jgi:hypothetical protein
MTTKGILDYSCDVRPSTFPSLSSYSPSGLGMTGSSAEAGTLVL